MEKEYLIGLTKKLYELTLAFPKKEPLRYKMRELADEVLACFVSNGQTIASLSGKENLKVLNSFFEIAKSQNWTSPLDCANLQEEYNRLNENAGEVICLPPREEAVIPNHFLTRQEKILEFLKDRGRAQVGELKKVFPQISKRTLRRDFESLLGQGRIERLGNKNDTFYQLRQATAEI